MSRRKLPPGIELRQGEKREVYSVRYTDDDGSRPRRTFESLEDAIDFQAKRRSAKRWRPEELRQEQGGRVTLTRFFDEWWMDIAMVELRRSTLSVYRALWEKHAKPRLGSMLLRDIDARAVVKFRGQLIAAEVGTHSIVKTMAMLQRVFRDAVEFGDVAFNPFKAVKKPTPPPAREVQPLTPLQVEKVAADLRLRGYEMSAVLVLLMAYTGLRPQEALGLQWSAIRKTTLLVEVANTDGEFDQLKNRKRSRKRSRSVDLLKPVVEDLRAWRRASGNPGDAALVFPHGETGELWKTEEYKTWGRRTYVPSAENVGLPTPRPYDLRHTWTSLRIAEKRMSIAEIAEQLGDKSSTVLDVYSHVMHDWRQRRVIDVEAEIRRARKRLGTQKEQ